MSSSCSSCHAWGSAAPEGLPSALPVFPASLVRLGPNDADHPGASEASRRKVKTTLFSAPGTKRSHLGTAHRKVLDSDYLEVSHVSQFLILNCPLRQVRA